MSKIADDRIVTTLGKETSFSGTMRFDKSLKIEGRFQGRIASGGSLYVEQGAEVDADIEVGSVIIAGTVRGNVLARDKVELLGTARLYGDIRTAKLKIADGVLFEGKCEMIREGAAPLDIFAVRSSELKESLKGA